MLLDKDILNLLAIPTSPFREQNVKDYLKMWSDFNNLPNFEDSFGNVWINILNKKDFNKVSFVLIAHMDHPGIIVHEFFEKNGETLALGDWLGGVPDNIEGAFVNVFSPKIQLFGNIVEVVKENKKPKKILIKLEKSIDIKTLNEFFPWGACIWFKEMPQGYIKDENWHIRAADDQVMIAAILQAIKKNNMKDNVAVLFSRSEEKGEIGSYFAAADTPLSIKTKIVSADITNVSNKKELGCGVIFRESDNRITYDSDLFNLLVHIAEKTLTPKNLPYKVKHQRSKGATDVSAFESLGFKVASVAIPLWNYHNKNPETGRPSPEIVHSKDLETLIFYIQKLLCL